MHKHEIKNCPRCNAPFECKVGDVSNCQCNTVTTSDETKAFLKNTFYNDCLCHNCLTKINNMVEYRKTHTFPSQKELMIEGLHYYTENGYRVFTELYHIQRGYCCKNNCRHCAYGYNKL